MWKRFKAQLTKLFRRPETPQIVEAFTSSYYVGLGLMFAIMTQSVVVLLVFTMPALIWWIVSFVHQGVCNGEVA